MQNLLIWTRRIILAAMVTLLAAYVLFFTLGNTQHVSIDFLFARWSNVPVELLMVSSFITGGLVGLICTSGLWFRCRVKLNKAQLELNKFNQ